MSAEDDPHDERWQLLPALDDDAFGTLKADIAANGVRVPVVVDAGSGAVIDGHHRVRAWSELRAEGAKVPDYPADVRRFSSDEERAGFALAANLFRRHLGRDARAEVVAKLRAQGWSLRRIADALGIDAATVHRDLGGVADSTPEALPERVSGADGKAYPARVPRPVASVVVASRRDQARAQAALRSLPAGATGPMALLKAEERARRAAWAERRAALVASAVASGPGYELRPGDFAQVLADVADATLDAVVTDPPYNTEGVPLYGALGRWAAAKLKPGRLAVVYAGNMYLDQEIAMLARGGLSYVWHGVVVLPGPHTKVHSRMVNGNHRSVLLFAAGDYRPRHWVHDTVVSAGGECGPGGRTLHPWQQALDPFRHWVRQVSEPGEVIADPFLGSGTTAIAAIAEARRFVGADIDPGNIDIARQRIEAYTTRLSA